MLELLQSYLEWRSAAPGVYSGLAPAIVGAIIGTAGPLVLDALFGGASSADKQAQAQQAAGAKDEGRIKRVGADSAEELHKRALGAKSAMGDILKATKGLGANAPRDLEGLRKFKGYGYQTLPHINFDQMVGNELLMELLRASMGQGTPLTAQGAAHASAREADRNAGFGAAAGGLASIVQNLLESQARNRGKSALPPPPNGSYYVPGGGVGGF